MTDGVQLLIERFADVSMSVVVQSVMISPSGAPPAGTGGGGDGSTLARTKVAASTLSGHRIVRLVDATTVDLLDVTNPADADAALGMTLGAAGVGNPVVVAIDQDVVEPSWAWTPDAPIYATGAGLLTQVPPSAPDTFLLQVGFATSPTSARIRVGFPLML